jgi:hypothetical protein
VSRYAERIARLQQLLDSHVEITIVAPDWARRRDSPWHQCAPEGRCLLCGRFAGEQLAEGEPAVAGEVKAEPIVLVAGNARRGPRKPRRRR